MFFSWFSLCVAEAPWKLWVCNIVLTNVLLSWTNEVAAGDHIHQFVSIFTRDWQHCVKRCSWNDRCFCVCYFARRLSKSVLCFTRDWHHCMIIFGSSGGWPHQLALLLQAKLLHCVNGLDYFTGLNTTVLHWYFYKKLCFFCKIRPGSLKSL